MSITDILEQKKRSDSRIYGVVVGIVTNNKDTEKLGRIKVKIPRLSGEDESNWARVTSFMAGKERGAFFLPEVDDEVLVAFEYGDINMPYVIGSLWNGKDVPPENNSDGKNNIRVIRSRSGHVITLDDSDGSEQIKIMDKTEKNMIIIDTKNNTISIKSDKDIELSAPNGKVTIEAMDIETKSTASTKIEATSSVDVKASGNLNIKGAMVNIN
ncbi:MAG: phage tail protein [ANME-2 cluster archaeon]|nr:phage tail protein [ANME-2 cluster archaeon]MBC2700849.1 phage tail protein [ANME-2 cluster archaeon]MBC2709315.1 phage tail protein [ANME-2 cluster archaeon]MBC2746844.1 phage tail protein [ANME-2 cluster archaeon]